MKFFQNVLLIYLLVFGFTTMGFSQIFNFDYFHNEKTSSTQTSLTADDQGNAASVHQVTESGIIADQLARDILVNVVDVSGSILFTKKYGNAGLNERGNSIVSMANGDFIIAGTQLHPYLRANGVLVYRINSLGAVQWARWYGISDARVGGEGFVIRKIDEDQLLIAGTATSARDLIGLMIKSNGGLIWSKRYSRINPSSEVVDTRVVTELIEDQTIDGYVIAGTHYYGNPERANVRSNMFTFGIDFNGNVTRKYIEYELKDYWSFDPAMSIAFQAGSFVLTAGAMRTASDGLPTTYTVVMELDDNLEPLWTMLYFSPFTINQHGHSIYKADYANAYMVGCSYQGFSFTDIFVPKNTAFLSVRPNGKPNYLYRYKQNRQQLSTYMAFDEPNNAFLLKSDNTVGPDNSLGLIRTNLYGYSNCAQTESVDAFEVKTAFKKLTFGATSFGGAYYTYLSTVDFPLRPDQCFSHAGASSEDPAERRAGQTASLQNGLAKFTVTPTLLSLQNEAVSVQVEVDIAMELTLRVYDSLGREVKQLIQQAHAGSNRMELQTGELPAGINVIALMGPNQELLGTTKIVKQ